jgi:hypothetical protein
VSVAAFLCLLVPTVGSFYPVPAYPANIFPYLFLGYLALGAGWLFTLARRQRGVLARVEGSLELALQEHEQQQFSPAER